MKKENEVSQESNKMTSQQIPINLYLHSWKSDIIITKFSEGMCIYRASLTYFKAPAFK